MIADPTYDPATQTVAADDGSRLSVWEIDECPKCGGHLVHAPGAPVDLVLCVNAVALDGSTCDLILEREAVA